MSLSLPRRGGEKPTVGRLDDLLWVAKWGLADTLYKRAGERVGNTH